MKKSNATSKSKKCFILTNKNLVKTPLRLLRQMSKKRLKNTAANKFNLKPAELDRKRKDENYCFQNVTIQKVENKRITNLRLN